MRKRKKIFGWLIRILLVCVFLAGVVVVFTPGLLNLELVKTSIREKISREVGGQIAYRKLKLSYFPRPHVSIQAAKISIPDSFTIDIRWMRLYPKLLPLLRGEFEIAVVTLDYADYSMKLPQIGDVPPEKRDQAPSFDHQVKALLNGVRKLPEFKLPEGNLRIRNGRINLTDPFGHIFKLRELQAAYVDNDHMLDFSIKCKSNLWNQIEINGSIDPKNFKGVGRVRLSRFRPQTLIAYLLPQSSVQIMDTRANVSIDLKSDGSGNLQAEVEGAIPLLELIYAEEKLVLKESRVKGTIEVNQKSIRAELTELKLADPRLDLNGLFVYDEKQQDIRLSIAASQIQTKPIRQAALKLAGASKIIEILCDIIRGGNVSWITVDLRGAAVADFSDLDNLIIKGRMERGEIYIPGAELDLTDVFGDVDIINGVLHGKNLTAGYGNSLGRKGTLAMGLNPNLDPFHLDIGIQADLSRVPAVLKRLIPDTDFQRELGRIQEVNGKANGILILGDSLNNMGARIEVSDADFMLRYDRIPYPIGLKGGRFVHADRWISMQNFSAAIGPSTLSGLWTAIDWTGTPKFEAGVRSAKFNVEQLYTWLSSIDTVKPRLADFRSLTGSVTIDDSRVVGPLFNPQKWDFQSKGSVNQLVLNSARLPANLLINRGQFTWQKSQIKFSGVDAAMGKSSITRVSGRADWKKRPSIRVRAEDAIFDPEDISSLVFTDEKYIRTLNPILPLNGKLVFKNVTYSGPLSGATKQKPEISAAINRITLDSWGLPGTFRIGRGQLAWRDNQLVLKDLDAYLGKSQVSNLSAVFDLNRQKSFKLSSKSAILFPGEMYPLLASFEDLKPGINTITAANGTLALSEIDINGPFNAPQKWHWQLKAEATDVVINSEALKDPLRINRGAIVVSTKSSRQAPRKIVNLKTIDLHWGANHLNLTGSMDLSEREILTNLNVEADGLDWEQIDSLLSHMAKQNKRSAGSSDSGKMLGTITVRSAGFKWGSHTVSPLEADVTFQSDKVTVTVKRADLCGISIRGLMNFANQTLDLYVVPTTVNGKLESTLPCWTAQKDLATGTYNLSGEILAKAKTEAISRSLTGQVSFSAEEGRIYRFGLLAKLLAILNVTEIYRGEIPDLTGEGFAYHSMTASAKLQGSKIIMEECSIDGVAMGIACEGEFDLVENKIDLLILVAPFKTVDRIVEILPLIGNVLGGNLISIPFKAKGNLNDPDVYPLPPTAVGSGILGILERTLKLPITIIQPVISGIKGSEPNASSVPEESPR